MVAVGVSVGGSGVTVDVLVAAGVALAEVVAVCWGSGLADLHAVSKRARKMVNIQVFFIDKISKQSLANF